MAAFATEVLYVLEERGEKGPVLGAGVGEARGAGGGCEAGVPGALQPVHAPLQKLLGRVQLVHLLIHLHQGQKRVDVVGVLGHELRKQIRVVCRHTVFVLLLHHEVGHVVRVVEHARALVRAHNFHGQARLHPGPVVARSDDDGLLAGPLARAARLDATLPLALRLHRLALRGDDSSAEYALQLVLGLEMAHVDAEQGSLHGLAAHQGGTFCL
mmetsp:Transcript_43968/g.83976  ORF Transcript_43968/g.83976 Transcript_43968/m.83976 type:complete len:213 (-) Transcript_43968:368-1006(-)